MKSFFQTRVAAFRYALAGLVYVLRTQRNAWIHAFVSTLVLLMCFWLQLSPQDWAIIILTIAIVWAAEFINTALEAIVDLASPQQHPLAKVGKDVGAAAVLIAAMAAVLVGFLIMGPPLWNKLFNGGFFGG